MASISLIPSRASPLPTRSAIAVNCRMPIAECSPSTKRHSLGLTRPPTATCVRRGNVSSTRRSTPKDGTMRYRYRALKATVTGAPRNLFAVRAAAMAGRSNDGNRSQRLPRIATRCRPRRHERSANARADRRISEPLDKTELGLRQFRLLGLDRVRLETRWAEHPTMDPAATARAGCGHNRGGPATIAPGVGTSLLSIISACPLHENVVRF